MRSPGLLRYAPECVEGNFSEVRPEVRWMASCLSVKRRLVVYVMANIGAKAPGL